jgi:hypothetical protein
MVLVKQLEFSGGSVSTFGINSNKNVSPHKQKVLQICNAPLLFFLPTLGRLTPSIPKSKKSAQKKASLIKPKLK